MAGEWEDLTLGDLGRVVTGKTPLTAVEGNFGGQIPFVTPSDMDGRKSISTTSRFLTQAGAASVKGSVIPAGAIMVSCIGSDMGKVVIAGRECVTNQQINSIVVDDRFSSEFVYYSLSTRKNEIRHQAAGGSAVPILNKGDFSCLEITLPPLAEQKAIAAVLGALDDKIESNRRMNATLEAMARALFQSWFIDFDPVRANLDRNQPSPAASRHPLPLGEGRGEGRFALDPATAALFPEHLEDSPLGHIPKGWEVKPLSELCQLGRGASPRPINDYMNGEVPWVKIADATAAGGPFLFETKEKVKKAGAEKSVAVAPGDLILSNSATCGVPMFVELHGCIHDGWLYFKNLRSISKLYLFHVLIELAEHLVHIADGSVQKNLNTSLVGQQNVLVPPKEIVDAFDAQATVWFAKMRQNGLESRTLATLRDTLLPKLLSGELSVAEQEN
jgi:type I restriction enzyme S subunit